MEKIDIKKIKDKFKELEGEKNKLQTLLFSFNKEAESLLRTSIIDIIKTYGIEKDGWLELDLGEDGLVVTSEVIYHNAVEDLYGTQLGIAMRPLRDEARIKKLKIATERRYIGDFDTAAALVSLACGHNLNHVADTNTILMDCYHRHYHDKDRFSYTNTRKGLYFTESYTFEQRSEFLDRLVDFINEKYK